WWMWCGPRFRRFRRRTSSSRASARIRSCGRIRPASTAGCWISPRPTAGPRTGSTAEWWQGAGSSRGSTSISRSTASPASTGRSPCTRRRRSDSWRPVAALDRVEQRFGRDVRIEHAQLLPEMEAPGRDRDAVVVAARDEVLAALPGEGAQDLEVRLHAQLLVGGGLEAEVRDEMALRVRLVVLGLADRDDAVAHGRAGGERHQMLVRAQAQVAPRRDAVGAGVQEELGPLLQPAAVEAFGVARVELLDVQAQLGGQYGFFRDGHGLSDL